MKKLGLILLTLLSTNSFAAMSWSEALTIKDVAYSKTVISDTFMLQISFDEMVKAGECATSETSALYTRDH